MAEEFAFASEVGFDPEGAEAAVRQLPARPGVFALRGARDTDQPYLMRAADMRRRARRLLVPAADAVDAQGLPVPSRRLNLRERVHRIQWTEAGSEFEGVLLLYRATHALFGEAEARKRLRLHCPYFLRISMGHQHPRVYVTNKLSRHALRESFGPFASRAAAERMAEAVGEQFKVRRCHEDLEPHPDHPGCVYGEMGRCLAPCKQAVTAQGYREEAERVLAYLRTQGDSLLSEIAARRDQASEEMDFEQAAALHRQWEKVRSATHGADPAVRSAGEVQAVVLQTVAPGTGPTEAAVAVFLLQNGRWAGPAPLSTLGVRAVREQTAVGSSLFAQPLMLQPVAEDTEPSAAPSQASPEERARQVLQRLQGEAQALGEPDPAHRGDALALFKRWYYRPEKQRTGEVLLPNPDGTWPLRRLLLAAARVALGSAAQEAEDGTQTAEHPSPGPTRMLHPGREGVAKVVPVLPARRSPRGKRREPAKDAQQPQTSPPAPELESQAELPPGPG